MPLSPGEARVRDEMAVRLARACKTTPQFWLNLPSNQVVWELERLHRLAAAPAHAWRSQTGDLGPGPESPVSRLIWINVEWVQS